VPVLRKLGKAIPKGSEKFTYLKKFIFYIIDTLKKLNELANRSTN
jgi:hypothetical protein